MAETKRGAWSYGSGLLAGNTVTMHFDAFTLNGTASADGSSIGTVSGAPPTNWGQAWHKHDAQLIPTPIHTVHLVFMNHLDIGYTETINTVDNEYVHDYFTKVANLADSMRDLGGTDRFVYITHPWLMSLL